MLPTLEDLGIDRLNTQDRLQLIERIWDSLSTESLPSIPESHRVELDERLAEAEANPTLGSPWEDVRERLRGNP